MGGEYAQEDTDLFTSKFMPNLHLVSISGNLDRKVVRERGSCSPGVCNSTCGREAAQKRWCFCQGNKRVQRFRASSPGLFGELGFALAKPGGGQEAQPACALPQGGTLPLGEGAQLAQAAQHTLQLKPARPCFSLAEVPAAFRNPDDKVQAKRKESRSSISVSVQISNCSPLNRCFLFFAIMHEKNSCLSCFN